MSDRAQAITDQENISYLYKYRSLAGNGLSYVEQILLHSKLYFPRPTDFNDPFDCQPVQSIEATEQERRAFLIGLYKRRERQPSRIGRRQFVSISLKNMSKAQKASELLGDLTQGLNDVLAATGVLSLSAKCDDVLMWSHYSDSHRGVCLRFKATNEIPFFGRAQKVTYQPDRPVLNLIRDTPLAQTEKALLTKADFWSYEQEWRIIEHESGPGERKFPAELLDGVILGARISLAERQRICEWVSRRKVKTEVLEARFHPKMFRIEISDAH